LELEGELDGAGAADLVEEVEAAGVTARVETACQRLRRAAEKELFRVLLGLPKFGWLKMLKNSTRKRSPRRSPRELNHEIPVQVCPKEPPLGFVHSTQRRYHQR
jgi:hypothetical protein